MIAPDQTLEKMMSGSWQTSLTILPNEVSVEQVRSLEVTKAVWQLKYEFTGAVVVYVGSTDDLVRHVWESIYRPTQGNRDEYFRRDLLLETGQADLFIGCQGAEEPERNEFKRTIIEEELASGRIVLNREGGPKPQWLIDFRDCSRANASTNTETLRTNRARRRQWQESLETKKTGGIAFDISARTETIKTMRRHALSAVVASGAISLSTRKEKGLGFRDENEFDSFLDKLMTDSKVCALTGLKMKMHGEGLPDFWYSLDRIDSTIGYVPENLQLVCRFANRWKGAGDNARFRSLVEIIRNSTG